MSFFGLMFDGEKKVSDITPDGLREYLVKNPAPGFYEFQILNGFEARIMGGATDGDKDEFMSMSKAPIVNGITTLYDEKNRIWFVHPTNINQPSIKKLSFPVPLFFAPDQISILQPIQAWVVQRTNRRILVYKSQHFRYPSENLDQLRAYMEHPRPLTGSFSISGFSPSEKWPTGNFDLRGTPEEMQAFTFVMDKTTPTFEKLVRECLNFINATFVRMRDEGNGQHRIYYEYVGESGNVVVNDQLTCLTSGICLDGGDSDFDLASVIIVKHKRRY